MTIVEVLKTSRDGLCGGFPPNRPTRRSGERLAGHGATLKYFKRNFLQFRACFSALGTTGGKGLWGYAVLHTFLTAGAIAPITPTKSAPTEVGESLPYINVNVVV